MEVKQVSNLEQILSSENLNEAFLQVKRNNGAEGDEHLKANGNKIKEQIRKRKYKPQAVRRVEILDLGLKVIEPLCIEWYAWWCERADYV